MSQISKNQWIIYAIASGGCAALNGVFAKLTTTNLTTTWAIGISRMFGMGEPSRVIEVLVRGFFFSLNLIFNAVMWGLFTRALTLATSTVRVSVINTSANFFLTALLGLVIFSETLPGLWWLGASFLVAGSVIIGRRDESKEKAVASVVQDDIAVSGSFRDEPDAPLAADGSATAIDDALHEDSIDLERKPEYNRQDL